MGKLVQLEFAPFDPKHQLQEQRELFFACFPETKGTSTETLEHYQLKFHSKHEQPPSYEFVALDKDDRSIVGYYAALPYRYNVQGASCMSGMVCDVMCHGKVRGQGVFRKLGIHALAELKRLEVDFTTGFPIRPDVFPGHLKAGWTIAFDLPLYIKPLKARSILKATKYRWATPIVDCGLSVFRLVMRLSIPTPKVRIETLDFEEFLKKYESQYHEFLRDWGKDKKVHLIKDSAFLQWRFSAPTTKYTVTLATKGERIHAVAFVRSTILKEIPSIAVLDMMTLPGDEYLAKVLYRAFEDLAVKENAETIAIMTSAYWAKRYRFLMHGILKTPFTFKLIVKQLSDRVKAEDLVREEHWHPMWIDSDDL
jgi:hypothetical protein